MSVERQCEKIP